MRLFERGAVCSAILVAGLVLGACTAEPPPQRAAGSTEMPNLVPGVDIPAGQIDRAVERLDELAESLLSESGVPGMAVAVVHDGNVVYRKGFGVRNVETREPVGPETVFQLASVSKSLAATVVARQVTAGTVAWDTPVRERLPWFELGEPYVSDHVTVGDLFSHRSGLPDHAGDLLEDLGFDRGEVLRRLRLLPLDPFRDSYAYTNFGLTAAAEAVAAASGMDWEALSEQTLYEPLGMAATSSRYAGFRSRANRADGHHLVDGAYRVTDPPRDPDAQTPAGGVSSSVDDVAAWMRLILADGALDGREFVAPDALLPAVTPQAVSQPAQQPDARSGFYGFGFNVSDSGAGRVMLSHSGGFDLGAATAFALIPSVNVGIVTLTNGPPIGVPETLNAEFADLVQFGDIRQDWRALYEQAFAPMGAPLGDLAGRSPPTDPAPARPLAEYAGTFGNDYYGPAVVAVAGTELTLTLGPRNMEFPLRHWDGDTFVFTPSGENATAGTVSRATFDGDRLILEYYDADGLGTFTRAPG
ncbi:serine hydrolase [Nocardia puris]|uniref:CubicO group peptidase (Beta-lactamase class C family) n=1 Tax=Nocardia puris TaxID=208602 RepID=A0A366DVP2_9NOCA|nr:CubicO group peptidase (beta-lactamase class C family) [Nocardia puris]